MIEPGKVISAGSIDCKRYHERESLSHSISPPLSSLSRSGSPKYPVHALSCPTPFLPCYPFWTRVSVSSPVIIFYFGSDKRAFSPPRSSHLELRQLFKSQAYHIALSLMQSHRKDYYCQWLSVEIKVSYPRLNASFFMLLSR
jgi:hypothetical protein